MKTLSLALTLLLTLSSTLSGVEAAHVSYKAELKIPAYQISNFSTDGCSAYPDGNPLTEVNEWVHCCIAHDMRYWIGGTAEEKQIADENLRQCIAAETTENHGKVMELGVAIGGTPYLETSWRWGYGWNRVLPFGTLSEDLKKQAFNRFDSILYTLAEERKNGNINYRQTYYLIVKYQELREELYSKFYSDDGYDAAVETYKEDRNLQLILDMSY